MVARLLWRVTSLSGPTVTSLSGVYTARTQIRCYGTWRFETLTVRIQRLTQLRISQTCSPRDGGEKQFTGRNDDTVTVASNCTPIVRTTEPASASILARSRIDGFKPSCSALKKGSRTSHKAARREFLKVCILYARNSSLAFLEMTLSGSCAVRLRASSCSAKDSSSPINPRAARVVRSNWKAR